MEMEKMGVPGSLSSLGFPVLRRDDDQERRSAAFDRAILADRATAAAVDPAGLPLGWYALADGRRVYGQNDVELLASVRESWRVQRLADIRLALVLDAWRPAVDANPPRPGKLGLTGDLFGGGGSSLDACPDARQGTPTAHGCM